MVTFWGVLSDRIGRKIVYVISFILQGIILITYPFIPQYWMLIPTRVLFSVGISGANAMLTCALGNYKTSIMKY